MSVTGEMLDHSAPAPDTCPECGVYDAARSEEELTVTLHPQNAPELVVEYTYRFPAYTCACGFSWTGYEKEQAESLARVRALETKVTELARRLQDVELVLGLPAAQPTSFTHAELVTTVQSAHKLAQLSLNTKRPGRCPRCASPAPHLHPQVQHEGEIQPCPDRFHARVTPENTPEKIASYRAVLKSTGGDYE